MPDQICIDGVCYATNPNAPTTTTTTTSSQNSNGMSNVIIRQDRGCVTIASLDKDIRDAQRRVDAGRAGAIGSLEFRKKRKELFLSGAMDSKLVADGCPPLGGTANTTTSDSVSQISSGGSSSTSTSGSSSSSGTCTPQQIRTGTCGQRRTTASSGGCTPQQIQTGTCGQRSSSSTQKAGFGSGENRGLILVGALLLVGAGGFWAYRTGKLDGVIAKAKGFTSKLRKK